MKPCNDVEQKPYNDVEHATNWLGTCGLVGIVCFTFIVTQFIGCERERQALNNGTEVEVKLTIHRWEFP